MKAVQLYLSTISSVNTTVTLRLGQNPDDDIIFASQADKYVPSGGGFSKLLLELNQFVHGKRNKWASL